MVWPSHVAAPDLPGEVGSAGVTRELSRPRGCAEDPDLTELGEGPETVVPAVRPGGRMPRGPEARGSVDYEKSQGLDTLAGGTPICMYRQTPSRPQRPTPPPNRDRRGRSGQTQLSAYLQLNLKSNMSTKVLTRLTQFNNKEYAMRGQQDKGFRVK
jgi:hypothetical protein